MEQNNLVMTVNVPYEVEISATGIPLHESKVEFCIHQQDVRYAFPAKMVTDNKFVFKLTDAVQEMMNNTLEYRLYVFYGNARFEADTGTFNLVDASTIEAKIEQPTGEDLAEKVKNISKKRKKEDKVEEVKEEVEVTPEEVKEEVVEEVKEEAEKPKPKKPQATPRATTKRKVKKAPAPDVTATPPVPTPVTTKVLEAKRLLHESIITGKKIIETKPVAQPVEEQVENTPDVNDKIKEALAALNKTATPSIELEATPTTEQAQEPKFFDEINRMKKLNEERATERAAKEKDRKLKEAIRKSRTKD